MQKHMELDMLLAILPSTRVLANMYPGVSNTVLDGYFEAKVFAVFANELSSFLILAFCEDDEQCLYGYVHSDVNSGNSNDFYFFRFDDIVQSGAEPMQNFTPVPLREIYDQLENAFYQRVLKTSN